MKHTQRFAVATLALAISNLGAPPGAAEPPAGVIVSAGGNAVFEFGRSRYFHALAEAQNCKVAFVSRYGDLDARERAAAAALGARHGARFFDEDKPVAVPSSMAAIACSAATLVGWEDKVARLERVAAYPEDAATYLGLTPADCRNLTMVQGAFRGGVGIHRQGGRPAVKASLDGLIKACGETPALWPYRTVRAAMAVDDGDDELALDLVRAVPIEAAGPVAGVASWLRLRLYAAKRDAAAFAAERAAMLARVDQALGAAAGGVERFTVGSDQVAAYQTTLQQGPFQRHFEFIIAPGGAFAEPESMMVTTDANSAKIAQELGASSGKPVTPPVFVDRYNCQTHATVKLLPGTPDYAAAKALVVKELTARPIWTEGKPAKVTACHWPQFVTPGLATNVP